jgi:drug/metabolite transporter (DMT)-like permease
MNSVLFGLVSAVSLGVGDFMARFSSRALGASVTYALVLCVGVVSSTLWIVATGTTFIWSPSGYILAVIHGFSVAIMCMLLYTALARGPIAIVAPIVAAHPALVLVFNVVMGLRPSPLQWIAMATVIFGGILIAHSVEANPKFAGDNTEVNKTVAIAFAACLAYVMLVVTGQASAPRIGELQTLWIGRTSGLVLVGFVLLVRRRRISVPVSRLPFVGAQGILDTIGYGAFLAGSKTANPHVVMVVASTFSLFTVLLARFVLKESIGRRQWLAIAMIAAGTAILSGV